MTEDGPIEAGDLDAATERQRAVAADRVAALLVVERLIGTHGSVVAAIQETSRSTGHSERTIAAWRAAVRGLPQTEWAAHLLPRWTGGRGRAECSDEAWKFFLSAYLRPEQPSYRDAWRRTCDVAKVQGWTVPSEKVLRQRLQRELPPESLILRRRGADALASTYPAQERDRSVFRALEAVNADGHRWDVMVRWPDGEVARPTAVVFQDLLSGKILSWRVDRTENASAIRLAFGDMCEEYGICEHAYLDNGRGFASKWLTGQMKHRFRFKILPEEPSGIMKLLGVEPHWVTPYHGQAKPIERAFRDLCETIAKHPSFSGAYTGNAPHRKPSNYGTRTIPLADFIKVVDLEIRDHNARAGRSSRVCGGELSFNEAFAASYAQSPVRRITEEQRRLLLLAAEGLKVREGGLHLLGNRFWCPELVKHLGKSIIVRFDPERVQAGVYIYTTRGEYVGFAECLAAVGFADADAAREHNRKRRAWVKAARKAASDLDLLDADDVGEQHLAALAAKHGGDAAKPETKVVRPVFGRGTKPATVVSTPLDELERDEEQGALICKVGSRARRRLDDEFDQIAEA